MRKFILTQVTIFAFLFCTGQEKTDTLSLIFNAKLNTIRFDNLIITRELFKEIPTLLTDTAFCKTKILKEEGFNKVLFIKVELADASFPELVKLSKVELENKPYIESKLGKIYLFEFVLAYSFTRNRFYKIKGFSNNEFDEFFFDYMIGATTLEKDILKDKKKMLKQYSIDEIDLECLLNSTHSKKVNYDDFPCLRPAYSRMMDVNGMIFTP